MWIVTTLWPRPSPEDGWTRRPWELNVEEWRLECCWECAHSLLCSFFLHKRHWTRMSSSRRAGGTIEGPAVNLWEDAARLESDLTFAGNVNKDKTENKTADAEVYNRNPLFQVPEENTKSSYYPIIPLLLLTLNLPHQKMSLNWEKVFLRVLLHWPQERNLSIPDLLKGQVRLCRWRSFHWWGDDRPHKSFRKYVVDH